jgi:phospholipid-binding lipoprotein MlaA
MRENTIQSVSMIFALAMTISLGACAGTGEGKVAMNSSSAPQRAELIEPAAGEPAGADQIADPFEGYNRAIFSFNNAFDNAIGKPVAKGYRAVVPQPARTGIRNVLKNLKSPVIFGNQVLQGDLKGAANTLGRTVINTLIGVGGLFDVAEAGGIPYESEDFGQTLGVWGVGNGPYVVLPLLGPSSFRDAAGMTVDAFADPLNIYLRNTDQDEWLYARLGVTAVDTREEFLEILNDLEKNSIDYYSAMKSSYIQRRIALIADESPNDAASTAIPDYDAGQQ